VSGPDPILELLDVVLHPAPGEVVADQTRSCTTKIGDQSRDEVLAQDPLLLFVPRGPLHEQSVWSRPATRLIRELRPLCTFFPWVGLPGALGERCDPCFQALRERRADAEAQIVSAADRFDFLGVETGVHAQPDIPASRNRTQDLLDEALDAIGRGTVSRTQTTAEEEPRLVPEGQQRMQSTNLAVPIAGTLAKISVTLDDRAVEIDRGRLASSDPFVHREYEGRVDDLHLLEVAQPEGLQALPSGRRCWNLQVVTQSPRHILLTEYLEVAQAVAADHEVAGQAHHEVLDRDTALPLLHRETLQISDETQPDRKIDEDRKAGEGSDLGGGSPELDRTKPMWDLHLESAPSSVCGRLCTTPSIPGKTLSFYIYPA